MESTPAANSESSEAVSSEGKQASSANTVQQDSEPKKHDYKKHEFKPKSERMDERKRNFFIENYDRNYKKLLIIPVIATILAFAVLFYGNASTGEFFQKDVSIKGGVTVTILQPFNDVAGLESFIASSLDTTVNVRQLSEAGAARGIVVDAGIESDEQVDLLVSLIQEKMGALPGDSYSVQVVGSALGSSFFRQVVYSILLAFVFMAIVIFIYFRIAAGRWIWLPSIFIIWTVFVDIISTLAVVSLLEVKISTAGLAAFLLLIGYSVDTDILLTMRVLKGRQESLFERILSAAKTGIFMTLTGMAAIAAGLLVTQSDTIRQIMLILVIGLAFDLIHTWITNAGVLRWYMERNRYDTKQA